MPNATKFYIRPLSVEVSGLLKKSQVENDQFREAATGGSDKNVDHQIRRNKICSGIQMGECTLLYGFINDINGLNFRYDLQGF